MRLPLCYALLCFAALSIARADTLPAIIDSVNPAKPAPNVADPAAAKTAAPTVTVPQSDARLTPDTPLTVNHIQFIGGKVYPLKTLLEPFRPLAGKTVPLKEVIARVNDITARYRADGYPLSYAWLPDDNYHNGNINIVLVEGYVAHSDIKSNNASIAERLKRLAEKLMTEKPLRQDTFDRYSQLMTRTPGTPVEVSAQLPKNIYGAAAMSVEANQPRIWDLSSTLDVRKGENLALVNGTLSNLTSYGDQLGLATFVPLDGETKKTYVGLNYQQFLNDEGLSMQLKGSYYRDDPNAYTPLLYIPGYTVEAQQKATQYNGGVSFGYPLLLTRQKQISLSGGVDYTNKRNEYALQARGADQTIPLESLSQHTRYPALDLGITGYREFTKASLNARLNLRQGLDTFDADVSPAGATDLDFTRWKGNVDGAWLMAEKWRLSTSLEGVWSDNDLPESERVQFGAQRFGRGYQDGEASGDYGYGGQVELRYLHMRKESKWLATVQPYVLADNARTWFNAPGFRRQHLSSVAAGVMVGDNKHYSLAVEAARPTGDMPTDSSRRDWRYSLTVTWNFNNLR
ncbi:ShlB/FhaC/HecB family hemolysin secretion/activation protein [Enterobacter sp.]|uniref:ShlB/FhaC/HecB family hemolysin secretion/activation protein n=1 Tax=Enterobacter sp. TaxID=42895 RepID=UPI00296EE67F|nr:ShlB/FhaC/HecB family hemolysin secretion/activation protein [Enterobacter sp.]